MKEYGSESSIGARVRMTRRARGYRTVHDLAKAIPGSNVTGAVIENIEGGRKADVSVSQLLNIAMALRVPPSLLLAPLVRPSAPLDLPNLSDEFQGMSAAEFDSWFASVPMTSYRSDNAQERNDRAEIEALRELETLRRELDRLTARTRIDDLTPVDLESRILDIEGQILSIVRYLQSAGWDVGDEN